MILLRTNVYLAFLSCENSRIVIGKLTDRDLILFSLPVSLLLVGALKQYSQMLSKINESDEETVVGSLGM